MFLVYEVNQMGSHFTKYYNLIMVIGMSIIVFMVLILSLKWNFMLHFVGPGLIINYLLLLLAYRLAKLPTLTVLAAEANSFLVLYFIIVFFFNTFWVVHAPLAAVTFYFE